MSEPPPRLDVTLTCVQDLVAAAASLSVAERHALAATLRSYASQLDPSPDADDGSEPWQLDPPHSEAMPWKLLLSQWSLLGPRDQASLRGVCSGLRVADLSTFLLTQRPSVKYTRGYNTPEALRVAHNAYAELCFIRDLQTRCAAAEARELAIADAVAEELERYAPLSRSSFAEYGMFGIYAAPMQAHDEEQRRARQKRVRASMLPGDPRLKRAAQRLDETRPAHSAATVAGSFALHRLLATVAPRLASEWQPEDIDVFVQSRAAYMEAIACVRQLVVALGGSGYCEVRGADRYGWPMDFEGEAFAPEDEFEDVPTAYGFAPMAPFPKRMVHEVAAGRRLANKYTHMYLSPLVDRNVHQRRPKPLRAWLDKTLPEKPGEARSYGLYTSCVLEVVSHPRLPACTTPPESALRVGSWMGEHERRKYKPLLRVNLILIGSRAAHDAMGVEERMFEGVPQWGSDERILPAQIAAEFDMHTCAVAMRVDAGLEASFVHSEEALRCATEGKIELTRFAFCSEECDRTNAICKVLRRIEKYMARGFELARKE